MIVVRIIGALPAVKMITVIEESHNEYEVNIANNKICGISDGV